MSRRRRIARVLHLGPRLAYTVAHGLAGVGLTYGQGPLTAFLGPCLTQMHLASLLPYCSALFGMNG